MTSRAASSVLVLVADGVRPDTLREAMDAGEAPALARLRAEGSAQVMTTVFPSVTGLAYLPFCAGRHPVSAGIPGLRWFDRSREHLPGASHSRSYIGWAMRHFDRDMMGDVQTLFEQAPPALGAMTMVARGLPHAHWEGRSLYWQLRGARVHFLKGGLGGWMAFDRDVAATIAQRVRTMRPRYMLAAILSPDKASHAKGHDSREVRDAIRVVDDLVATLRADAERDGRWAETHVWVVSDHGHAPISQHDELVEVLEAMGLRAVGHPLVRGAVAADAAVMVSGNAMAHIYLEPSRQTRLLEASLAGRWGEVTEALLQRPSVDIGLVPLGGGRCVVHSPARGRAMVSWEGDRYSYVPGTGDPLALGTSHLGLTSDAAYDLTIATDHPDSLVQIARTAAGARSGDVILSAAPGWDFRRKFEPVLHVSGHGALHRDHMLVPLITNHPTARPVRRSVDVGASAAALLGVTLGVDAEARSFM